MSRSTRCLVGEIVMKCTHKGRQEDGTWCVSAERCPVLYPSSFIPPKEVVDAISKTDGTPAAVCAACPDYYTALEVVRSAFHAGLTGKVLDWRNYVREE